MANPMYGKVDRTGSGGGQGAPMPAPTSTPPLAHPTMPVAHQNMPVAHNYDSSGTDKTPTILGTSGMLADAVRAKAKYKQNLDNSMDMY